MNGIDIMEWLKNCYRACPKHLFMNHLTYREVYDRVSVLARKLSELTEQETRVALYGGNSLEMVLVLFALLVLKKEVVLLNSRLTDEEVQKQVGNLSVALIFSSRDGDMYISFAQIGALEEKEAVLFWEIEPESIAVIMNTSATSGEFKSVPIRWKQIAAHVRASAQTLGCEERDNWLLVLPLFHISGLSILLRSLYNRTRVTLLERFDEEQVLGLIEKREVTMLSLTPSMLARIIDRIKEHSLRVILLGGEFIPCRLMQRCLEKRLPVYKTYGMTETTSQSATFCILDFPDKIDSVGRPLPGVDIAISHADAEGIGEIGLKSPMLMDGYLGRGAVGGVFHTGDMGYKDAEGFLYIVNRRSDMIISGGENIYPKEIEDLLYQLPGVKECAVVGKDDDRWGQVPVLYLVSLLDEEEIRAYLAGKLARYKMPKSIIYREVLPKNDAGKIMRRELPRGMTGVREITDMTEGKEVRE